MPPKEKRAKKGDKMAPKEKISKEQTKVAKWLRRNLDTKTTKFMHSHKVEYFLGSKAVDALLEESPFAMKNVKDPENELYFEYREQCVTYLDELLKHKMFHRAKKIAVSNELLKPAKKKSSKKEADEKPNNEETEEDEKKQQVELKKKGRKIRLDMHLEQVFLDTNDAYVWIYDPTAWYYWAGGALIVFGTIAMCLFPLWPPWMRLGVHYLSIGAAGFLIAIMSLGVLKYLVFATLFALSAGKLKLWIFPNLTEDVGFFDSFVPVCDYTYTGPQLKKRKKDKKDSDIEESDDDEDEDADEDADQSESDESTSKKSSVTGKDFEMVDDKNNDTDS